MSPLMRHRHVAGLFLLLLAATAGAPAFAQDSADHPGDHSGDHRADQIGRHGAGHSEMHDVYKAWHPPDNPKTSCCNNADCRPTRAYVDDNGAWRAGNGLLWLVVPPERVVTSEFGGYGRSHLC